MSNGAENHLHTDAHVLNTIGDVVGSEVLRFKAVKRARFLHCNYDNLLPKGEKNDALDRPKLGDGAERLQLVRSDNIHEYERVHGNCDARKIDEIDPDVAKPGVDSARTQDVVGFRDHGGECGDWANNDVLQAASLAPCVAVQKCLKLRN